MPLVFGPILQFRGVAGDARLISALVGTSVDAPPPQADVAAPAIAAPARQLADLPRAGKADTRLWRIDLSLPATMSACRGSIEERTFAFALPAPGVSPRMAYASCNGFSDPKLMKQVAHKNERWEHLLARHSSEPYHLLLLGGDQVYSDEIWKAVPELDKWTDKSGNARWKAAWTPTMQKKVERFFAELYLTRWSQPEIAAVLAAIPTIMMWDDHDIFDGWGSYPAEQHDSPVFQGIYRIARDYFRLFQLQCAEGERHPAAISTGEGFHLGFAGLGGPGGITLLAPDLRAERRPASLPGTAGAVANDQVVSPASWKDIYAWLDACSGHAHLLLMSSIPVAYLDLGLLEKTLNLLPGQQELEDDLRDHWRSLPHQQERLRLIHRLLEHARTKRCRVTLLSGDVHLAALAVIESERDSQTDNAAVINQLISSAIVHPGPPALARYVLEGMADKVEQVDRGINAALQPFAGQGRYLIGARNWLALEPDEQRRIWANWHVEGSTAPVTKVIHPCKEIPDA